jgi:hypothetical protein
MTRDEATALGIMADIVEEALDRVEREVVPLYSAISPNEMLLATVLNQCGCDCCAAHRAQMVGRVRDWLSRQAPNALQEQPI